MMFDEETNEFINVLIISGSFITAITCIALIIYHAIEHINNLENVLVLGLTGFLSIWLMYSIISVDKEKKKDNKLDDTKA